MKNNKKKDLAKMALAAVLLAASLPAASYADEIEVQGILLAGGCGGDCSSTTDSSASSSSGSKSSVGATANSNTNTPNQQGGTDGQRLNPDASSNAAKPKLINEETSYKSSGNKVKENYDDNRNSFRR